MNKTLHLTHPEFNMLSLVPESILLFDINQSLTHQHYHTSLGDLTADNILSISDQFDTINFVPTKFDVNSEIYHETTIILNYLSHRTSVSGYITPDKQNFLSIDVNNRPSGQALWVFGCSNSYGVGLLPEQKNFGQHLSQQTNMPLKLVARPGSSVQWSLRHLMHANFKKGDIVIWQLTTPARISYGFPPTEILLAQSNSRHLIETYTDQHLLFHQLSLFNQGVRYLKHCQVKFAIISIANKSPGYYPSLAEYSKHPEFCYVPNYYLDLGTDNLHMGPLSHKAIAQHILDHIQLKDDQSIPQSSNLY